jgi:hypothetical protein
MQKLQLSRGLLILTGGLMVLVAALILLNLASSPYPNTLDYMWQVLILVIIYLSARELTAGASWPHTAATLAVAAAVAFIWDQAGPGFAFDPLQPEPLKLAVYGLAGALTLTASIISIRGLRGASGHRIVAAFGLVATGLGFALWLGAYLYGRMAPEYPGFSGRDFGEPFVSVVLGLYPVLVLSAASVRAVAHHLQGHDKASGAGTAPG